MRLSLIAIMTALVISACPGAAQAQAADPDVQCLALSKVFAAAEKDPNRKQLATASAFFYLGRIDARLSPAQLRTLITAPNAQIKKSDAGALMTACARRFQTSQQALMNMGSATAPRLPGKK